MRKVRKLYLDWGEGWVESNHVIYNSLSMTHRAASDNYHRAQNVVSFSLAYDLTTFSGIYNATSDIKVKVTTQVIDGLYPGIALYPSPNLFPSELGNEYTLFTGIIPPTASRTYNGKLDNTILRLEGTDSSEKLNKEVGDVLYENFTIMNPANKATSIVHQLAYLAGFTDAQINQDITIATSYPYFAPNNEKDKILDVLDILLFENGYVMNMDEDDKIKPLPWIVDTSTVELYSFDEDNIINEVRIDESLKEIKSVAITYYGLKSADNVRIYTENLPYASDGSFAGYSVPAGYYWPIEANTTDRITGTNKVIYQEYDDAGIKFRTNEAIVKKLDYNYKAFDSDFSGTVATKNHVISKSIANLSVITESFGNKKAQILYKNNTGSATDIFYMHIDATVVYKSSELQLTAGQSSSEDQIDRYGSYFVHNATTADALAKNMVQMYDKGNTVYSFDSEVEVPEGAYARIQTADGTDQICFILERTYNEETLLFNYKLKGYAYNGGVLIGETEVTKTEFVSPGTIAETSTQIVTKVPVYAPTYKGIYQDTPPSTRNEKDSCLIYSTVSGTRGLYTSISGSWVKQTDPSTELIANSWADICAVTASGIVIGGPYGVPTDYTGTGVNFIQALGINTAFINNLFANYIKIGTGGSIYGGDRFNAAGTEVSVSGTGFYLGADGKLRANLQSLFKGNLFIGTDAGLNVLDASGSDFNVGIGHGAGRGTAGFGRGYTTVVGYTAGYNLTNGGNNTFLGAYAGLNTTSGINNTYLGASAGVGSNGGARYNTYVGQGAGLLLTGEYNTCLGLGSGSGTVDYSNITCLGYNAAVTGSDQVQLGNSATTTYVYGTVQNRSDIRDKLDVQDIELGLAFVKKLRPVSFRWNYREDYIERDEDGNIIEHENDGSKARSRRHNGLIAQEIKQIIDETGVDFGGYQDHSVKGGKDVLSLGYEEFIAPMIKAIQELSARVETLEKQLKEAQDV